MGSTVVIINTRWAPDSSEYGGSLERSFLWSAFGTVLHECYQVLNPRGKVST